MVLNSQMIINFAKSFAERLRSEHPQADLPALVRRAYLLALGRQASDDETKMAVRFVAQQREALEREASSGESAQSSEEVDELTVALTDFCHALMNSNEFIYVD